MKTRAGARAIAALVLMASFGVVAVAGAPPAGAAIRDTNIFACPPGLTSPFADSRGTTHEAAVACAVHYELVGGTSATTYSPNGVVSRGQMATFIARVLGYVGLQAGDAPSAGFTDTRGSPHEFSIDAIVAEGIASGTTRTTFGPTEPVSRAQMATFLRRTAEVLGFESPPSPPDAFGDDQGSSHERSINILAATGVAGGTAPGAYSPGASVTRGAMASFLVRLVDLGIDVGFYFPFIDREAYAALTGASGAVGTAVVGTTDVPNVLCVELEVRGTGAPTAAHIHAGTAGTGGPVVVELDPPALGSAYYGCVSDPDAGAVLANPGNFAVDVHTASSSDGVLHGQLGSPQVTFGADLSGSRVVPGPGDAGGFGHAVGLTTTQPNVLCLFLAALTQSPITGVHIHQGTSGTNGPEVLAFTAPSDSGIDMQCRLTSRASDVAANPAGFYVDVHTASFPDGALRGQLAPA